MLGLDYIGTDELIALCGVVLAFAAAALWFRYYRLSRSLKREIAQRKAAQEKLTQSEERYRLLVENAPFPVLLTDLSDHTITYVNSRAEQMFGASSKDVVGRSAVEFYVDPDARVRLLNLAQRDGYVRDFETLVRNFRGEEFWASINADCSLIDGCQVLFSAFTDVTSRKMLEDELRQAAHYDSLTGLANRRRFFEALEREIDRAARYGHSVCLMMADLDHFKGINDRFGHQVGDEYLRAFAGRCRVVLRGSDVMGRIGGEEFTVLLPETSLEEAAGIAERLRQKTEALDIGDGRGIGTTISIGVVLLERNEGVNAALRRADQAMYKAKSRGRNGVVVDDPAAR